jgi:hypothetical protein
MTSHTHETAPTQFVEANNFFELTGRKPTTWAEFAKTHGAAFKH